MKASNLFMNVFALTLFAVFALPANVAAQPSCGDTINADTTLNNDILDCPGRGLRIGASDVTLDCNGHTIEAAGNRAVEVNSGQNNVTVKNCVLVSTANTDALRVAGNSTNTLIANNNITTSGVQSRGVRINNSSLSTVSNNTVATSGLSSDGIRLTGGTDSLVAGNSVNTSGAFARGIRLDAGSDNNLVSENEVRATGRSASAILMRSSSDANNVERNLLRSENSQVVRIESSSDNVLLENTLASESGWLRSRRFSLQNGGFSVHPDGRLFAVENSFGGGFNVGTATALIEVNPATGEAISVTRLTLGGSDLDFGFDALEITPFGRFIAIRGAGFAELFEIDPVTGAVTFLRSDVFANGLQSTGDTSFLATTNFGALLSFDLNSTDIFFLGVDGPGWTDIAVHPSTGVTYATSRHITEASGTNHLYVIDPSDGSIIAEIGDIGEAFVSDIDFDAGGTLYGNASELLNISPDTAETEIIGSFGEDPFEPPSLNNVLKKTTLVAVGGAGSVHYSGTLSVPSAIPIEVSSQDLNISFNRVFLDSDKHPFLNQEAIVSLLGLPGEKRRLLVDENDDGVFESCRGNLCKLRLFKGGTLVFEVNGFTTYSSEERIKNKDDDDDDD